MSELTDLVAKQNEESYQLGKKHGAIEELEKIKAEITEYRNNIHAGSDEFHIGRLFGCDEMVEIIDKHISELKGE